MKNVLKTELWKATHNFMFVLSLGFGTIICFLQIFQTVSVINSLMPLLADSSGYAGISLFRHWIGIDMVSFGTSLFYLVWPILAAMPYGWSFSDDRHDGKGIQIITRCSKQNYYLAKYIAVFVSGGVAVAFPVLLNLFVLALICPYDLPHILWQFGPVNFNFLANLYYTQPWLYAIAWSGITFICGGVAAGMCLLAKLNTHFKVLPMMFPFVILFIIESAYSAIRSTGWFPALYNLVLSPLLLIRPFPGSANPGWAILLTYGCLFLLSFGAGYWKVTKYELV